MPEKTLRILARELKEHVDGCATASASFAASMLEIQRDIAEIKALPMRAVRWLGGIIVVAVVTVLVQNFLLQQQTNKTAAVAATQAQQTDAKVSQLLGSPQK